MSSFALSAEPVFAGEISSRRSATGSFQERLQDEIFMEESVYADSLIFSQAFFCFKFAAYFASFSVAASRCAVLASIKNDLQVKRVPAFFWEKTLQVALGLNDVFSARKSPARGQAMDVRVDGKAGHTKRLRHHHLSRFVADSGQGFERIQIGWDFPAKFLH